MNDFTRTPYLPRLLLLFEHLIQDRHNPILKLTVVFVGNKEVPDPIHPLLPQLRAVEVEIPKVRGSKTLDEILFDAACGRDDRFDMSVFDEMADGFTEAGGDEIRRVSEEYIDFCCSANVRIEVVV